MNTAFQAKQLWEQLKDLSMRIDNYLLHACEEEDDRSNENFGDCDYIRAESPFNRD